MIRLSAIAVTAALLCACDGAPRELVLVRPDAPVDEDIAASVIDLVGSEGAVRIRQSGAAMAGAEALQAVADGTADLALISNDQPFREDIATIMPLYATVLHIVHLAESKPDDAGELLRGARVYAGPEGSASRRVFERLTASLDFGSEPYTYTEERGDSADVAVVFAPLAPDRLAEYPEALALWSIATPGSIGQGGTVDGIVLLNPHFRPFIIPAGTYGAATPQPVVTIAVDKILVTRKDLDESVVYDLINALLRIRPALASAYPGLLQDLTGDFDASRSTFVLHQGAQDFLHRSEPKFVERYSGVAEVLVTLMIAAISAVFAGVRIYNRRRKNRIDRFYAAVIDIRKHVTRTRDPETLQQAVDQLRDLQEEAFALLVDEKLAADDSFRIFITLSNDVLEQIRSSR